MNIKSIVESLKDCTCGREHILEDMVVEIGPGLLRKTPEILEILADFPRKLLVVADKNTLAASEGILEILQNGGFSCKLKLFEDLRVADIRDVDELVRLSGDIGAVLSVGSGSLNDICRLASFRAGKPFAIFATAPSMDGFAAASAPITFNNFKKSLPCHAPKVIIGDTEILAKSPKMLKSAGFGDMLAKYIALVDWKIANLTVGEYYCPGIAAITKEALEKVAVLADVISTDSAEAAGALMEGLVLSGLAITLTGATRPASGAEHVVSHFWEIIQMERGQLPDFHGRKVAVATLMVARLYHDICKGETPVFQEDTTGWAEVYAAYGSNFTEEVEVLNNPTVTDKTNPKILEDNWREICDIVNNELPGAGTLFDLMKKAGVPTGADEIGIDRPLALAGLKYHPYMRHRINLTRLIPMLGVQVDYSCYL